MLLRTKVKHDPWVFLSPSDTCGELGRVAFTSIGTVGNGIGCFICPPSRGAYSLDWYNVEILVRKRGWRRCTRRQVKQLHYLCIVEATQICKKCATWHVLIPLGGQSPIGHFCNRPALTRGVTNWLFDELRHCWHCRWNRRW